MLLPLVVLWTIAGVCLAATSNTKWKCDQEDARKIDEIVSRIHTYGRTDNFPLTVAEAKPFCKDRIAWVARMEDYKNACLKQQPKQIASVIIYSMKTIINSYCKNPHAKKMTDFLTTTGCANDAKSAYQQCNDDYIDLLLAVWDTTSGKTRLAQMCW